MIIEKIRVTNQVVAQAIEDSKGRYPLEYQQAIVIFNKLDEESKKLMLQTLNGLQFKENPVLNSDVREQQDVVRVILQYAKLLESINIFQLDKLKGILKGLNSKQQLAAIVKDGPLLLSAGPGSGKTRTLTFKIAMLIDVYGIDPRTILGVTFTNKAAQEMTERIKTLAGNKVQQLTMGTFHSVCGRFLRQNIEVLQSPYNRNFVIESNPKEIIQECMVESGFDKKLYRDAQAFISDCKNNLLFPEDLDEQGHSYPYIEVYKRYRAKMMQSNLVDFDDLIMITVFILRNYPHILEAYQNLYQYILVDEYQDSNPAQYEFIRLLSEKHRNITVVGDEDQSVYAFRGADIRNILNFVRDYVEALSITLNTNYRSTKTIVEASSTLIVHNKERLEKEIMPFKDALEGDKIQLVRHLNEQVESSYIAKEINHLLESNDYNLNDVMVLYRVNSLSRSLEESMLRYKIPYTIVGGVSFYEREEITDLVSYIRLAVNIQDNVAFKRIYNTPNRRIGDSIYSVIVSYSADYNLPLFPSAFKLVQLNNAHHNGTQTIYDAKYLLTMPQLKNLYSFLQMMKQIVEDAKTKTSYELLKSIIEKTEYKKYIRHKYKKDLMKQLDKISNIDELLSASTQSELENPLEFLTHITLMRENNKNEFDFEAIVLDDNTTFDIKAEKEELVIFGVKNDARYELKLPLGTVKDLTSIMKNVLEEGKDKGFATYIFSNIYLEVINDKFVLAFDNNKYEFVMSIEQAEKVLVYFTETQGVERVRLMSMHSAKGLEAPIVFIIGAEQGLSPHFMNMDLGIEEERRLFYVAMTRAEKILYISSAEQRMLAGRSQVTYPSQFIREIDKSYLEVIK